MHDLPDTKMTEPRKLLIFVGSPRRASYPQWLAVFIDTSARAEKIANSVEVN
jgi:hypothetical protein